MGDVASIVYHCDLATMFDKRSSLAGGMQAINSSKRRKPARDAREQQPSTVPSAPDVAPAPAPVADALANPAASPVPQPASPDAGA
eukprot:9380616-Alexandrium_andersonii.AAC.1